MKCPNVEVVATLILQERKLLTVYNPRWGAFSFPMSKRKQFTDEASSKAVHREDWKKTAARVAGEVLGRTFRPDEFPQPLCEIKDYEQSDADGVWKLYTIQVFGLKLPQGAKFAPGVAGEWLPAAELKTREPITRTARFILARLEEQDLLPPWKG